jgi:amidohydrolase
MIRFLTIVVALGFLHPGPTRADDLLKRVNQLTAELHDQLIKWRRHLHQYPELSNREKKTGQYVAKALKKMGVDSIQSNVAGHGVVGLIQGSHPGPTVGLRADIDALPVTETTGLPFASKNKGVMHACGHDVHTTALLGAARVLTQMRDQIHGTVKLLFQPAEEGPPLGEEGGAPLMIKEGVLNNPTVSAIFALHVYPEMEVGKLGYVYGGIMASVDQFKVVVRGKQVHAAYPWAGIDPVVASAHIITSLQTIASRIADAREPIVVSVGIVKGGQRWNIIPGQVVLEGTVRAHNPKIRKKAREAFYRLVNDTAKAHGCSTEITYHDMAPVTWNDHTLGRATLPSLERAVGKSRVLKIKPAMGGEDFAFYAKKVPGFYIRLGVGNKAIGAIHPLHTPGFMADEAALPIGARVLALMALDYLRNKSHP